MPADATRPLGGQVFVVTGATGALGSAVCAALIDAGATVHGTWVVAAEAEALAASLDSAHLVLHHADVTDAGAVEALFAAVEAQAGRLDGLVCVAGGFAMGAIEDTPVMTFQGQVALNLTSAWLCARAAAPRCKAAGRGRVVFVGSRTALDPPGNQSAYAVSKAGVLALTRALAAEWRGTGVTANAVLPGVIDTPANRAAMPGADHDRWVPPAAIAAVIVTLCGEALGVTSGALVPVYGDS